MSFLQDMIPATKKAANVCAYCRVRKQGCNRALPRCERCAGKDRFCDYTPYKEAAVFERQEPEPLVVRHESCSHADLSPHGTSKLLQAITLCMDDPSSSTLVDKLSELVYEILDLADGNLPVVLEEFGPCIQQCCPILPEEFLRGGRHDLSQRMGRVKDFKTLLLCLSLWLVTKRTCPHVEHIDRSELYRALKQVLAVLQSRQEVELETVQVGVLIAVYEAGHGLHRQASQTLAGCIALLRILAFHARKRSDSVLTEILEWITVSVLMLDRLISISMIMDTIPLAVLSSGQFSKDIIKALGRDIPAPALHPYATSSRKVHVRATVALAAGHVQEYVHARQCGTEPEETYDQVDEIITSCIKALVYKPELCIWLRCDAVGMAFCSHIYLQASHMQYLVATLQHPHSLEPPTPAYMKAHMALKSSRHMSWDMVRDAIQAIQSEADVLHMPFASLCCVCRAGLAVLETSEFVHEDVVGPGEVQSFRTILKWFAGRWGIGAEYLKRLDELVENSHQRQ